MAALLPVFTGNCSFNPICHFFLFCGTLFVYNLDRHKISPQDRINTPDRINWLNKYPIINRYFCLAGGAGAVLCLMIAYQERVIALAGIILFLSLLYFPIKKIPGLKSLIIAVVWSVTVLAMPIVWDGKDLIFTHPLLMLLMTLAFVNSLIFDMRDTQGDRLAGIHTLPVKFGLSRCRLLIYCCCLAGIFLAVVYQYQGFAAAFLLLAYTAGKSINFKKEIMTELALLLPMIFAMNQT